MTTPQYRDPPLDIGDDRHDRVKMWQKQLRQRGWHIEPDGIYGEESRRLCANFEMEHGLEANGDVDKKTWDATWEAGSTKPKPTPDHLPLKRGDKGDAVKMWQRQVNNRGFPALEVDGDFGPKTEEACKKFQKFKGLPETGKVDEDTWKEAWLEKTPVAAM
ncbi:peptidoglycan-binding domain-containing protein [[Actinomadura] parvosata]|uniref:peptidoglycan-binding domain-containing protein n=1 Tax=[Actinomadura] parvosata TaxID=1955412 RepID=UPI00406C5292